LPTSLFIVLAASRAKNSLQTTSYEAYL